MIFFNLAGLCHNPWVLSVVYRPTWLPHDIYAHESYWAIIKQCDDGFSMQQNGLVNSIMQTMIGSAICGGRLQQETSTKEQLWSKTSDLDERLTKLSERNDRLVDELRESESAAATANGEQQHPHKGLGLCV